MPKANKRMKQKKICMLGAFATGKTSLVKRYVSSLFSEKYLTTVGVKVDKKMVQVDGEEVMLMLWDLAGEDVFTQLNTSYLRGMAGYIIVIDGTRLSTFDKGLEILHHCRNEHGEAIGQVAVNKHDLRTEWEVTDDHIAYLKDNLNLEVNLTSAKNDEKVEELFIKLASS